MEFLSVKVVLEGAAKPRVSDQISRLNLCEFYAQILPQQFSFSKKKLIQHKERDSLVPQSIDLSRLRAHLIRDVSPIFSGQEHRFQRKLQLSSVNVGGLPKRGRENKAGDPSADDIVSLKYFSY